MLTGTTFWSFMREFPRDVLNWAPVRTVSPEQSPQTNVCATEIAILHSSCRGDFSGAVCHDILNESVRVLGQQAVMESMWTSRWGRVAGAQGLRAQKCVPVRRSIREPSRRPLPPLYLARLLDPSGSITTPDSPGFFRFMASLGESCRPFDGPPNGPPSCFTAKSKSASVV